MPTNERLVFLYSDRPGKIRLGLLGFKNLEQAGLFCSRWLMSAQDGDAVPDSDMSWVNDLLHRHPNYLVKTAGQTVERVMVRSWAPEPGWEAWNCFWLCRSDGSMVDISYKKCQGAYSHTTKVKEALREAVSDHIEAFRASVFQAGNSVACPETGVLLQNDAGTHIDHHFRQLRFDHLVSDFCSEYGYSLAELQLTGTDRAQAGSVLADQEVQRHFQEYHATHAKLRAISKRANLRAPRSLDRPE